MTGRVHKRSLWSVLGSIVPSREGTKLHRITVEISIDTTEVGAVYMVGRISKIHDALDRNYED